MHAGLRLATRQSDAVRYFADVRAAYDAAAKQYGASERYFHLANRVLCLRFAGNGLRDVLPAALAHLEMNPAPADLTVLCWNGAQHPLPPQPWRADALGAKGHVAGYNEENIHTACLPGVDAITLYDETINTGLFCAPAAYAIPALEYSFPLRGIIHWWSEYLPFQLMHAAAVGLPEGGVLLAGKSGAGKSTVVLACLKSDVLIAGDDYALTSLGAAPHVHSLYSTAKALPDTLRRLPGVMEKISNPVRPHGEKALIYLQQHYPDKLVRGFPLKAIFLPRVTRQRDTTLTPATPATALFALAPTTVLHLEGHSQKTMEKIGRLARTVPCYWLNLGTELPQIPDTILSYLRS